jgi:hypothetical protein
MASMEGLTLGEVAAMGIGESSVLTVIGALLRFALTWKPRYVSVRLVGLIYINFQEIGLILMIGGAASLALWIALLLTRPRAR